MYQDELTITLRKPVTIGEGDKAVEYTEITLVEPTAGQIEQATKAGSEMGVGIELIRLVAKVPRKVVEQMGVRDLTEANSFLAHFSEDSPATGETSSQ